VDVMGYVTETKTSRKVQLLWKYLIKTAEESTGTIVRPNKSAGLWFILS
jgi:hypothetical protein